MGFIAIEWWPDDFAAIRYAVEKGIVVVEAAGNGFQNLDAAIYGVRPAGFPASWTNPFNPAIFFRGRFSGRGCTAAGYAWPRLGT